MIKNGIKLALAVAALAAGVGSATSASAYPPFLRQAMKFGAKDCLFCHTQPEGGEGWNARGAWLVKEKEKRMAEAIDVEWLKDYKEEPPKDGTKDPEKPEKKEPEKKDPEKKDPVKDPAGQALDF